MDPQASRVAPYRHAVLLVAAIGLVTVLGWRLRSELVLLFASVLFGIALYASAAWLSGWSGLSHVKSIIILYVSGVVVGLAFVVFAGHRIIDEYGSLTERIPAALRQVEQRIEDRPLVGTLAAELRKWRENMVRDEGGPAGATEAEQEDAEDQRSRLVRITLSSLSGFVLWAILSLFFALDGTRLAGWFIRLFPPDHRSVARDLVQGLGHALPWWIVGRLASMGVVAVLTATALMILGIPLAFTLALMAGLFSFVPFLGPIAATIPAVLVTVESAPSKLIWVVVAYVVVQFLESYLITPRIQSRVASVPPVILIAAQVVMGSLVGILGIMFATPLALALIVVVQVVYLRHVLDQEVTIVGALSGGSG